MHGRAHDIFPLRQDGHRVLSDELCRVLTDHMPGCRVKIRNMPPDIQDDYTVTHTVQDHFTRDGHDIEQPVPQDTPGQGDVRDCKGQRRHAPC